MAERSPAHRTQLRRVGRRVGRGQLRRIAAAASPSVVSTAGGTIPQRAYPRNDDCQIAMGEVIW